VIAASDRPWTTLSTRAHYVLSPTTAGDVHPGDHCLSTSRDNHYVSAGKQSSEPVTAQSVPVADSVVTYAEAAERNRENVFRVVTRKKAPVKKQVVVGSSTNNTLFKGVAKKAVVCVNHLDPSVSSDVVTEFLKDNVVNVLSCYTVKNKQPISELGDGDQPTAELFKEIRFISMRLCVSYSDLDKIFDTNLWPDGVVVRPWSFKTKANTDRQS